jgi:acetyltransferase-like isoleucine patch superfamily enzyme
MRIVYRDQDGRDRSRLIAGIVELHRWLPSRFSEAISWRVHAWVRRRFRLSFKWAARIILEGDGLLRLEGTIRVNSGTRIAVAGERGAASIGNAGMIDHGVTILAYGNVTIGDHVYIGVGAYIDGRGGVSIGAGTRIAPGARIIAFNHSLHAHEPDTMKGITIGRDVWIGTNCVILDGATIGDGAVVAAGAVVRQNVPPATLVGGVPAREIRLII